MKDLVYDIILIILSLVFTVGLVMYLAKDSSSQYSAEWNNGYCECGGHWEYEQAVGHQTRTSYIYRCNECGKRIEVWNINETESETDGQ